MKGPHQERKWRITEVKAKENNAQETNPKYRKREDQTPKIYPKGKREKNQNRTDPIYAPGHNLAPPFCNPQEIEDNNSFDKAL